MHMSADGIEITKVFEGCLKPLHDRKGYFTTYYCPAGVLTLGYGHTNLAGTPPRISPGDIWSQGQCDSALALDLVNCEERVSKACGPLSQCRFDALVDWDFNTGGVTRSSIPAKIKAGRLDEVGDVLMRWNKANGRELAGLTRRRLSNKFMWNGNPDQAMKTAGVHREARINRGELMPQKTDTPTPPPAEVVKRSGKEIGTIAAGGAGGTAAGTTKPDVPVPNAGTDLHNIGIVLGIAVIAVGVALLIRKYKTIAADWA